MSSMRDSTLEYLSFKMGKGFATSKSNGSALFTCPGCKERLPSAIFIPGTDKIKCNNSKCQFEGDLVDIVQHLEEESRDLSRDEIAGYLRDKYGVIVTSIDYSYFFNFYKGNNFDLVPLIKGDKIPFEKDWPNKEHRDIDEWKKWIELGFNIGVKTGKRSGITVIDVDTNKTPDILKNVETIKQKTARGCHYIFQYEPDLPSARFDDIKIDMLNDGKQFVAYPSIVDNFVRIWNFSITNQMKIPKMPAEVKAYFMDKRPTLVEFNSTEQKVDPEIQKAIDSEDLKPGDLVKEGNRTNWLLRFGGVLRKRLNPEQTEYVLDICNNNLVKPPLPKKEISNIIQSLDRYSNFDDLAFAQRIVEYLRYAEEGTSKDIEQAMGERKARVDKALAYLVKEQFVIKRARNFHLVKRADWKEVFPTLNPRVNFKVPYFDDIAHFNWGDMLLLGSKAKFGKTTISINILRRLVEQGIKPYYICLEPGSRFIQTACSLGLKEGDFYWDIQTDPTKVDLEKNAVTILDWLLVEDKSQTDVIMHHFIKQLVRTNGFLIVFQQIKTNGDWFAPNMATQFPAFAARYLYEDEEKGDLGAWHIDAIRESKKFIKKGSIPCKYLFEQKKLVRIDELPPQPVSTESEVESGIVT